MRMRSFFMRYLNNYDFLNKKCIFVTTRQLLTISPFISGKSFFSMKSPWWIVLFLFLLWSCNNVPDAIDEVVVSPTSMSFEKNDLSNHRVIEVSNNSKKRVFIHPIEAPCPCISVDFDNSIIKPGEKEEIRISYTGGYSNPALYSLYLKTGVLGRKKSTETVHLLNIRVEPNNSKESSSRELIQIIPLSIYFGETDDDLVKAQFSIINTGERSIIIEELFSSCDCITTDFDSTNNCLLPGEKRDIQVYYNRKGNIEPAHFGIYIKTNFTSRPYMIDLFANQ